MIEFFYDSKGGAQGEKGIQKGLNGNIMTHDFLCFIFTYLGNIL